MKKFLAAFLLLSLVLNLFPSLAFAQDAPGTPAAAFNTDVIDWAIKELCGHITGSLGGLLVTVAAFGAIVSAAMGSFRVTYSAIIVSVGAYAISSIESLYFADAANICSEGSSAEVDGIGRSSAVGVQTKDSSTNRSADSVNQRNTLYKDKAEESDPFAKLD